MSTGSASAAVSSEDQAVALAAGQVQFVGAGPGDHRLLTIAAVAAIRQADVLILDHETLRDMLAQPELQVSPDVPVSVLAEVEGVNVGEQFRAARVAQAAAGGGKVVRLVYGDPFLDASVAGEAAECVRHGLGIEVIPGVSSLTSAAEFAGVRLDRGDGIQFVNVPSIETLRHATWAASGPLVVATRVELLTELSAQLIRDGRLPGALVLVLDHCGQGTQRTTAVTLAHLAGGGWDCGSAPDLPVHVMIDVEPDADLNWWENRPLYGWHVLVPKSATSVQDLADRLERHGAQCEVVPTLHVEPPRHPKQMARAVSGVIGGDYQWVVFTSTNSVRAIRETFDRLQLDVRHFSGIRVAAIGEGTIASLRAWGIIPDLEPEQEQTSAALAECFPVFDARVHPISGVLLPRADIATETLAAALGELGWQVETVTAYRTMRAAPPPAATREAIKSGMFDAVVFSSSSAVRNLIGIAGKPHRRSIVAAVGPQTARTCEEFGLRVDVVAARPDLGLLADSLAQFAAHRRERLEQSGRPVLRPSQVGGRGRPRRPRG